MRRSLTVSGGLAILVIGIALVFANDRRQSDQPQPVASPTPSASPSPLAVPSASAEPPQATSAEPRPRIPDGYRVQIPRLGIDLPLAEGDVVRDVDLQKTPEGFAFHLPGSSIPGLGSNTYLYAHARVGMFLSLWDVQPGDAVFIATPTTLLKYVVSEIHPRVPPQDVSWIQPTPSEQLTLQTSTGPNPGDPRFVVIALPVS